VTYDMISVKLSNSIFTFPCLCQPSVMSPVPFMPEKRILELVLDILQRDTHEIFAEPVDPKEVEDYYEIIKEPMDFGTMRAKHHEGINAMHFNSTGTIYFKEVRYKCQINCMTTDVSSKGTRRSLNGPSNLRRNIQGKPGFSCTRVDTREHDFPAGARDGRRSNYVEVDRRCTYKPWLSFHMKMILFFNNSYPNGSEPKLQGCLKDDPNFQTPASNSFIQVATGQVPAAFASAHNGPSTLDTLTPNPLKTTTTDIIDLTDADDGEKAHTSDRMSDHSGLGGKIVTNRERDGKKTFNISDRDKVLEKQISKTHLGLSSSTSAAEVLNSCKSVAATVDSSKTDSQVQPSNLASKNSCSNKFEFKLRNSNSSTSSSSWIWHTSGVSSLSRSDGSMAAAVGPKGEKSSSSLQEGCHTVESNGVVPLVSPFAFDLPFLKARLNQFQQVSVNEGPIPSSSSSLSQVNQCDISYRESLMLFAKGLGPTAQMVANRKLQGCLKDDPNFQTPASNSFIQVATGQVPAAFASAHNGPSTLDTLTPNTSWDLFDPLPGCCSALKTTTTDIIDLTDADDGEKAHTSDRMSDHSGLGGKIVTNRERDGKKTFNISDRDKVLEKQISKTHLGLSSSTSAAEVLNSCKSVAATVDSSKTDSQVQPSNLASKNSCSNKFEFKLRNSNSSTSSSSWIWHTSGVSSLSRSDGSMAAAVGPKQVSVNEGPIPSSSSSLSQVSNRQRTFGHTHQAELTIQSSQLAMAVNNQQCSVPSDTPDTNLALQLQL
ncbi:Bromodomain and PHD finger-containing protein 3, partial [Camellia lanceoleosa]